MRAEILQGVHKLTLLTLKQRSHLRHSTLASAAWKGVRTAQSLSKQYLPKMADVNRSLHSTAVQRLDGTVLYPGLGVHLSRFFKKKERIACSIDLLMCSHPPVSSFHTFESVHTVAKHIQQDLCRHFRPGGVRKRVINGEQRKDRRPGQ